MFIYTFRCPVCCYLLPDGCLLRDGSESDFAAEFRTGGAAGYLEVVTWEGELVWSYSHSPYLDTLTHHDLEPLPNGNVLIMTWERRTKEEAVAAGRRPALLPDGEVWDNVIVELQPDGHGSATEVWRWSLWDHTVQDFDETKANYVMKISEHPEAYDINHCVCGGIAGARNLLSLTAGPNDPPPSHAGKASYRGEKDWLHSNSVSYDPVRDQVAISFNPGSEILIVDHSTTLVSYSVSRARGDNTILPYSRRRLVGPPVAAVAEADRFYTAGVTRPLISGRGARSRPSSTSTL